MITQDELQRMSDSIRSYPGMIFEKIRPHKRNTLYAILGIIQSINLIITQQITYSGSIWGSSADDIFVVYYDGTISHWDGIMWSPMKIPDSHLYLSGVCGTAYNNVYAVGESNTGGSRVLHWDGTSWDVVHSSPYALIDIWGSAPDNIIVVGQVVMRWDGSNWNVDLTWSSQYPEMLLRCWGNNADDVYAVGYSRFAPLLFHWDGQDWSEYFVFYYTWMKGIWGASTNDVYAVGANAVHHWDGLEWTTSEIGYRDLRAIWGTAANNIYAVGDGILHWDGTGWQAIEQAEGMDFFGIWGINEHDMYIIDSSLTLVWQWDGSRLSLMHKYANQSIYYVLVMPSQVIFRNESFELNRLCWNSTQDDLFCDEYIVLDVHENYWFYPSWSVNMDSNDLFLPAGDVRSDTILNFAWPNTTDYDRGLYFWGALCDKVTGSFLALDWIAWSYSRY